MNRLALSVVTLLGLTSPGAFADSVTNCNDTGAGSLRAAVAATASGGTVDMTGLTTSSPGCSASAITLKTGDIKVTQNDLIIVGPGITAITVTGKDRTSPSATIEPYRIFTHTGTGNFQVEHFSVANGYASTSGRAVGGCISSQGSVFLLDAGVYECRAESTAYYASGGGVYAKNHISLTTSVVSGNIAEGAAGGASEGGGVYALSDLTAINSTISGNAARGKSGTSVGGFGGGTVSYGNLYMKDSTVSSNYAGTADGGVLANNFSDSTSKFVNTTIAENRAKVTVGGVYSTSISTAFYNSTIAFNYAGEGMFSMISFAAGVDSAAPTTKLESTLIANNTYGPSHVNSDFSAFNYSGHQQSVSGSNNLVRTSSSPLPAGTITGSCPILGSLRNNGGVSKTMALQSGSPGIDQGNNILNLTEDERGASMDKPPYLYERVSGPAADIGAYEIQRSDIIFMSNLEGCTGEGDEIFSNGFE